MMQHPSEMLCLYWNIRLCWFMYSSSQFTAKHTFMLGSTLFICLWVNVAPTSGKNYQVMSSAQRRRMYNNRLYIFLWSVYKVAWRELWKWKNVHVLWHSHLSARYWAFREFESKSKACSYILIAFIAIFDTNNLTICHQHNQQNHFANRLKWN